MNVQAEKQRQKEVEFRCIEAVARAVGCNAVPEDESNEWPDGWLESAEKKRKPVEVVAAFKRPAGENPKDGASWQRHSKQAERIARSHAEKTGEAVSWHIGEGGFLVLDGKTELPLATTPIRQDEWVLQAARQKVAKHYATPPVLVVHLHSPLPLTRFEIERLAEAVRSWSSPSPFAALWVVNNYGDPPVKIPA